MATRIRPTDPLYGTDTGAARRRRTVAVYSTYSEAERAVDYLSDNGFPVERTAIVGRDLRFVEQVTGRLTTARAALGGALTGAVVGFFVGWLFGVFDWFNPVVAPGWLAFDGLWFGAILGALAGLAAHMLLGGRRDFGSVSSMVADRYEVMVDEDVADEARHLIDLLDGGEAAPAKAEEPQAGSTSP
jgi:hypothetical protein